MCIDFHFSLVSSLINTTRLTFILWNFGVFLWYGKKIHMQKNLLPAYQTYPHRFKKKNGTLEKMNATGPG